MNLVTPTGFRDVLPDEASERERITRAVQDLFAAHGFKPIETPTLEAMDVVNAGAHLPTSPFRFFDSQGDLLAMRPDVTLQVARMASTRLQATDEPLRLRYTQRIFRETEGAAQVTPREMTQIGVEVLDGAAEDTDASLITLMLQALGIANAGKVTLAMATVAPLRALLARSGGTQAWRQAVLSACHRSDMVELGRLTDPRTLTEAGGVGVAPAYAQAVSDLMGVRGGRDAIMRARDIAEPLGCAEGLDVLESAYDEVSASCSDADILVDFSAVSSFDYYTGLVFEAFSPHLGSSIGSGGRYDNMLASFGDARQAAGFAFSLEQAMAAATASAADPASVDSAHTPNERRLRIAVPKGALNKDAIESLSAAGLDVTGLDDPGRQLVITTADAEYIIVRPSDAPAFVAAGAADCGICGLDSLLESDAQVVQLADLKFGGCRFVVAELSGTSEAVAERYRRLGSIRVATKYPRITLAHFAKSGMQADIVKLNGNIELAPLTGLAERIVDITATGTTLRENNLEIVDEVLSSTARFFANPSKLRTDSRIVELSARLTANAEGAEYDPIAGGTR
ncbi:MAG: ATP phosphoribosyltransferase [Eggerthellaceae bacterium]|nr:ATP phosphoribosyltransferase [Eggerthellaceae bacterium]